MRETAPVFSARLQEVVLGMELSRRRNPLTRLYESLEARALFAAATSGFSANINFQPASAPVPAGYLVDSGQKFGVRSNGLSYGWNADDTTNTRDRNSKLSADQRYDTLIQMQVGGTYTWNIAVPNGTYNVHIVSGDPSYTDSNDQLKAENTLIVSGKPSTGHYWIDGSGQVTVSDGMLTIAPATGASNDKINFIQISSVPPVGDPGTGGSTGDGIDPGTGSSGGGSTGTGSDPGTGPETVQVSAPDPSAAETNLDPGLFRFTRTGPTDQDLTVNYLVTGTASAGGDFVGLPASVVIPAGQSSVDLPVTPIDDGQVEPAQTVRIELNGGNYVIGASQSATVTIMDNETSSTEQPYSGTAVQLSGTVQAEDFDQGPKGTAYSIATAATNKDVYRFSDVDIEPTTDTGGGFAVTNLQKDEWMRYRVNVPANGTYRIETRVASTNVGSKFHIQFNGVTVASLTMPNTGSVNTWTTLVSSVERTDGGRAVDAILC